MKSVYLLPIFLILLISGCTEKVIPEEDAIKIAEAYGIGLADGRIYTTAELNYSDEYNRYIWTVTKRFVWNRGCNFGEVYTIIGGNGEIASAKRFDDCNDFNKTIQEFSNLEICEQGSEWEEKCGKWKHP